MNSYQETMELRTRDCDLNGTWRFSAILASMQEAANVHCMRMGCERSELIKKGVVWVLVRSEIRMDRYPSAGEKVTIQTFHTPTRHRMFPRYYLMTDGEGKQLGMASTLWMLMNWETREAVPEESLGVKLPDNSDAKPPMGMPGLIRPMAEEERISAYHPVYTDLDINQHVNNTRYADWVCNQMGTEVLRKKEIARMILDYNAEVLPEQELTFRFQQNESKCCLIGLCGEKKAFEIGCDLRDRG